MAIFSLQGNDRHASDASDSDEEHQADQLRVLRMEFRSFLRRFTSIPAQIALHTRSLTIRQLACRPELQD